MKKIILSCMLLVAAAVCVCAQDASKLNTATRLAYEYLNQKGYVTAIDEDNDVQFVVKDRGFYLLNTPKDPTLLRISMPSVYSVDLDDASQLVASLQAINLYNRKMKLVKPALSDDGEIFFFADTLHHTLILRGRDICRIHHSTLYAELFKCIIGRET